MSNGEAGGTAIGTKPRNVNENVFSCKKRGWIRAHLLQWLGVICLPNGAARLWLSAPTQSPDTCSSTGNPESICCPPNPFPLEEFWICVGTAALTGSLYTGVHDILLSSVVFLQCCHTPVSRQTGHSTNLGAKTSPWARFRYPQSHLSPE